MLSNAGDRWLADPVECGPSAGFGLYLHVPFCAHRCGYCDFATAIPDDDEQVAAYVRALQDEVDRVAAAGPPDGSAWPTVTSVFVGGGTPTLLPRGDLAAVLGRVGARFDLADDAEVTVECNPETASPALFDELVGAGVTRLSMGAQSFVPHVLSTLERGHDAERPAAAVAMAREAGIDQVNLDLIYGTPGESDEDWARTLRGVLAAGVDHVSAYALTIHDNTPFGRAVAQGALPDVDEDVQRDRFDAAREALSSGGFEHYEVSNWALGSGARSRHNLLYWRHGDYLALGVGAHGHWRGRRWWNTRSTRAYLDAVGAGRSPVTGTEDLDADERAAERLLLGLRVREGLHPADAPPIEPLALEDTMAKGLVTTSCGRLQCTETGWFLLDEAVRLLT
jgi:putative oxygen-independent coproporphyrinogen III oxidase